MKLDYEPTRDDPNPEDWANRIIYSIDKKLPNIVDTLDLGMGKEGILVKMLRESGKKAFGIDLRNMGQEGLILADARALPFKDESFDLVTECFLLADMYDFQKLPGIEMDKVIQEAKRVLRLGGFFITLPSSNRACSFFNKVIYKDNVAGIYQK